MEDIRDVFKRLSVRADEHIEERPWGGYVDWIRRKDIVLKVLVLRPGARTSRQLHHNRYEWWRVLWGTGEDQGPATPIPLPPGKEYEVPPGQVHRLSNPGSDYLVVVEMQLGECREDDIVRVSDDYGRSSPPEPSKSI